jgi:hypothetical protein
VSPGLTWIAFLFDIDRPSLEMPFAENKIISSKKVIGKQSLLDALILHILCFI